jgi:hypothetical protein
LPEVREFLKQPGHADSYENLKIKWIRGKDPLLFIKNDAGEIVDKIDLINYKTQEIHDLLLKKGFTRKATGAQINSTIVSESLQLKKKHHKEHRLKNDPQTQTDKSAQNNLRVPKD